MAGRGRSPEAAPDGPGTSGAEARTEPPASAPTPLEARTLRRHPRKKAEGWEGISLEAVTRLQHGIRVHSLRVVHRQEVQWQAMVQGGSEEVYGGWPPVKELLHSLRTQRPLLSEDLRATAERICQNTEMAGNELGKELNRLRLAKAKELLSDRVQRGGSSSSLLPEVSQSCGVVGVQGYQPTPEVRQKPLNHLEDGQ